MSETRWTRGQWRARKTLPNSDNLAIYDEDGGLIAKLGRRAKSQVEANAHLIAAAPELYEALMDAQEALAHLQDKLAIRVNPPTLEKARAALAKAKGES